ncbi:pyrimidine-nucleoside phosphorylase, partial [Escherichia coli]
MRMVDLIDKKRDGESLSAEEIKWMIAEYTNGNIPDYQMSSMAMAIYFQDMNNDERVELTMAMVHSGDEIDLSAIE